MRLRPLAMADGGAWRELKDRNRGWLSRWEATVPPDDHTPRITYRQMVRRLRAEAVAARMLPFAIDYAVPHGGAAAARAEAAAAHPGVAGPDAAAGLTALDGIVAVDDATGMASAHPPGPPGARPAAGADADADSVLTLGPQPPPKAPHRGRRAHRPDYHLVGQLTVSSITWGSLRSANIGYWIDEAYAGRDITPTAVALAVDHCFRVCLMHRVEVCIRPENKPSLRVVEKLGFRPEGVRKGYLHIDGAWRDHATFALTAEEVPEGMLERWHARRSLIRGD